MQQFLIKKKVGYRNLYEHDIDKTAKEIKNVRI